MNSFMDDRMMIKKCLDHNGLAFYTEKELQEQNCE